MVKFNCTSSYRKTLENFTDEDEIMLYEKFKSMIFELDSLTKISKSDIDEKRRSYWS
jgi:hypothetical protein